MSFDNKVLTAVLRAFETKRLRKKADLSRRREEIFAVEPRIGDIDAEIKTASIDIIRSALDGGANPVSRLGTLRDMTGALREERAALLQSLGKPRDYLDETFDCELCEDTGFLPSGPCACLVEAYAEAQLRELRLVLPVDACTFDTFQLAVYPRDRDPEFDMSPRENMERVFDETAEFAARFGEGSPNLLLNGGPGLGKTFLMSAIAERVARSGHSVIYGSSVSLLAPYETMKFSRDPDEQAEAGETISRLESVDLLLYDDLGTEMPGAFTNTALYTLLNNRLMRRKKTAVASGLSLEQISGRYLPSIVSRLEGEFLLLPFFGDDIRILQND
ncbi:ATP-binding protein [Oscillospiraceae bacterium OttesenSCG-928-G22]|nr:ATP-binding protein [Oscillospiraceae bacterium OttesenSCG-928-G22]